MNIYLYLKLLPLANTSEKRRKIKMKFTPLNLLSSFLLHSLLRFRFFNTVLLLSVVLLAGCDNSNNLTSADAENNKITFQVQFSGKNIHCESTFPLSVTTKAMWQYTQLQFFISNIELKNTQGGWYKPALIKSPYQSHDIALLGEHCNKANKSKRNWSLNFANKVNIKAANAIRFTLGIPFRLNHLNPLTQESPLNVPSMFWGWQQGHKFLRLEMSSRLPQSLKTNNWLFHLGSVGCKASSPLRSPKQECLQPNRYTFQLPLVDNNNTIVLNLSTLLRGISLQSENNCQSAPDNKTCQQLMANLTQQDDMTVFSALNETGINNPQGK